MFQWTCCVSTMWSISAIHEYLIYIKLSSENKELWGLASERGAVEGFFCWVLFTTS